MLGENIKNLRKKKGISQEELAIKLNVVRQTVSKWEKGLSVPDSEMLIKLAEELDTTVNVLLGEKVEPSEISELQVLAAKLELLNEQFAKRNESRRKTWRFIFFALGFITLGYIVKEIIGDIYYLMVMDEINASTSIIGGADGPTQILVSSGSTKIGRILILVIVAIASMVGIYNTRRR
jgi:putative transcriptional regulator